MKPNIRKYLKTTRFRTTLWYSLVFLLLEVVIGIVIYVFLGRSMSKQLDISLMKQADMIYHLVAESKVDLNNFEPDSIYSSADELVYDLIFEAVTLNPTNTFVQVSLNDKIVYRTENLYNKKIELPHHKPDEIDLYNFDDLKLSKHSIRAAYLNKEGYKIVVAFPVSLINQMLDNLVDLYILIAPLFFLLSVLGGALISFKSLSRIDRIIKKTDEITTQNLSEIVEGEDFDDEYGRLVKTMNKMIKRIRTSIEYMDQFSISASHELKTPLTILRGEIELALKSDKTPEQYREILRSNYEETLKLINIINRLFYLSKFDHSLINLNKQKVDLPVLIKETIEQFKPLAEERKIRLIFNRDSLDKIAVEADHDLLKQVFINLTENAIKYSDENSGITIECSKKSDNKVQIDFRNYGEYIPPEFISKLFDRFYRLESSRNRNLGGVGLGLSVVKSIINLHGGAISASCSQEGEIVFTIVL